MDQIILEAKSNGSVNIGVRENNFCDLSFKLHYLYTIFIQIKKIVSLVRTNFVNGSALISSVKIAFNKTFDVFEGNNSLYFPSKTALFSTSDYLFVVSLNDTQIAAYKSNKSSDYIWSNNTLNYIDRTTNYQLNIQIVVDDYIFTNSFAYNYSYDYSGSYTLSAQAGGLNKSQLVTVLTGYSLFLLNKLYSMNLSI